jgi:Cdc6-like AAA superfamily ATPase
MVLNNKTFRVFVSSTFADLKEERNALQKEVFPKLRKLCMEHGFRFQAIDLRWGVSEEAGLDQQTMKICLEEIERSQKVSPKPNFIVLLGDRYGWRPLPYEIPADEFEEIKKVVSPFDKDFLFWEGDVLEDEQLKKREGWYCKDENAVPPVYCLKPRLVDYGEDASDDEIKARDLEYKNWEYVEKRLKSILLNAIDELGWDKNDSRRFKYESSATEQEIIKGVLNLPEDGSLSEEHVFSFIRTIKNKNSISYDDNSKDFFDFDEVNEPDDSAKEQLAELKTKVEKILPQSNLFNYETEWEGKGVSKQHIKKLCSDVYSSLEKVIYEQINEFQDKDPLDIEIEAHKEFGEERCKFFKGREDSLAQINNYLEAPNSKPLTIYGDSGSGKTSLMAYAARKAKMDYPNSEVIIWHVGATPSSVNIRFLLKSLCKQISLLYDVDKENILKELQEQCDDFPEILQQIDHSFDIDKAVFIDVEKEITPKKYHQLISEFFEMLSYAKSSKPLILFLDAVDELSEFENAQGLLWFPTELPDNVHIIVSTVPGECLDLLDRTISSEIVSLTPMNHVEGEKILDLWFDYQSRTLQKSQKEEVLKKFKFSGLPLYLKLAFEESKRWKSYTNPKNLILRQDIAGMIHDLLNRLSANSNHGAILVSRSIEYIISSRYGLSEDEIMDILSRDDNILSDFKERSFHKIDEKRLPFILWSRLYFDLEPYLNERQMKNDSLITFYNRQIHDVFKEKCHSEEVNEIRLNLVKYFKFIKNDNRAVDELPWQFSIIKSWSKLYGFLSDIRFFRIIWDSNPHDLKYYWAEIENKSKLRMVDAYKPYINSPSQYNTESIFKLSIFLYDTGHLSEAKKILSYSINQFKKNGNNYNLSVAMTTQAMVFKAQGDLSNAMKLYKELESISQELNNISLLKSCLIGQANILRDWGDLKGAMELYKLCEKISTESNDIEGIGISLGNQGLICEAWGDINGAIKLQMTCMGIFKMLNNKEGLARSFGNLAPLFQSQGDLIGAMNLHKEEKRIYDELNDKEGIIFSLMNQAMLLKNLNKHQEALLMAEEALKIANDYGYEALAKSVLHDLKIFHNNCK